MCELRNVSVVLGNHQFHITHGSLASFFPPKPSQPHTDRMTKLP